jgi:hypothetical protein
MEVGFSSLGSFSALFAERFGEPPSLYRRRLRSVMSAPGLFPLQLQRGCLSLMAAAFAILEKHPPANLAPSL